MTDKQYLLCLPAGGFSDVCSQLARARLYAQSHQRILVADARRSSLKDSLAKYFSTDSKEIILHPGEALLRHFDSLDTYPADLRGQIRHAPDILPKNRYPVTAPSLSIDMSRPYREDLLVHYSYNGGGLALDWLQTMCLVPEAALRIAEALAVLGEDYDAVHIRNTDIETKYLPFFREIFPLVRGRKLLVCSDDLNCREAAKKFFVESQVMTVADIPDTGGTPLHRYTEQDAYSRNLAMLTDLLALARAQRLFITKATGKQKAGGFSGFSLLAQGLRDHQETVDRLFASLPPDFPFAKSPVPGPDAPPPLERRAYVWKEQQRYMDTMRSLGRAIEIRDDEDYAQSVREMIKLITPMNARGAKKERIGGDRDGGYVMLDPGRDGIAYSLGISSYAPWDLEMARRGFTVYQYDGSIDQEPDKHPNILFHKCFVGSSEKNNGPCKPLTQILAENRHLEENKLILQMDIEGAEWEVFQELTEDDFLRFSQIIVELHGVDLHPHKYALLKKIRRTHTPIHMHYNNNTQRAVFSVKNAFLYSGSLIEVSYARTRDHVFEPCSGYFPTPLDRPNVAPYPEIPIGYFDLLPDGEPMHIVTM